MSAFVMLSPTTVVRCDEVISFTRKPLRKGGPYVILVQMVHGDDMTLKYDDKQRWLDAWVALCEKFGTRA